MAYNGFIWLCLVRLIFNLAEMTRVSVNAQTDVFMSENMFETSKIVSVIAVSNEYMYKILGQEVL